MNRITLESAASAAERIVDVLRPVCERVIVAGSIRRGVETVRDIEIIAIPNRTLDIFGNPEGYDVGGASAAVQRLGALVERGGNRYIRFSWQPAPIDLFLATHETWGCIATIRTGSADFSHWLVTPRHQEGGTPTGMAFKDGRLWRCGVALDTPEEADVFCELGVPWVEYRDRCKHPALSVVHR